MLQAAQLSGQSPNLVSGAIDNDRDYSDLLFAIGNSHSANDYAFVFTQHLIYQWYHFPVLNHYTYYSQPFFRHNYEPPSPFRLQNIT